MRICIVFVLLSLSASPTIQAASVESSESSDRISWLDQRHQQVSNSGDRLAGWVDAFFSSSRSVEDAASSVLRIRPQYDWDEDEDDWKLRVTGRLYLPAASDRLSLVFLGENEDDFDTEFYDPAMAADGQSTIGLQYRLTEERHSRIDLTAGLKSGPKGKIGAKYLYQLPFGQRNRFRFSEELFWIGGDGFGTLTRIDFDHALSDDTLLRWANKAEYSEESNGVEWSTRISWIKRLQQEAALRAFVFTNGETDPRFLKSRGLGVGYRRQFWRRWLFWEVEPHYQWRKERAGDSRDGIFGVDLRLELVFGERPD